ncbi:MAG TPA: ABC transporter permease [Chitinophagales bacterium]|nr:ABC transporter permease [Chitinophagales bacterium]
MHRIPFLLQKEFLQIFRTRSMLMIIFVMPVIQLLILSNAATYEIRNIRMHVMDADQSSMSRQLIGKFTASGYFQLIDHSFDFKTANDHLEKNEAEIIVRIPPNFERDLLRNQAGSIQFIINAVDGAAGGLSNAYASQILHDFNKNIRAELIPGDIGATSGNIQVTYANWFNRDMNYKTFMVPGLVVLLITMIGMFLCAMNIVREKEIGTIEQLNVTPISKSQFIIGKLLPFWILALIELTIGLAVGKLAFHIPMVGNIGLIYLFASVYLLVILGMGLLVSTFTNTQQQAMFLSWFFMVLFILMSGLFTPIESMPAWAQKITLFNPVAYFIRVMRMVMLKGSGFNDIKNFLLIMLSFAVVVNTLAVLNHRKTSS